ncbi:YbhB/YbcL family Raf kinase inhibitor-like protein [Streptacidiphilus melanogenes]|uniref:YbhB/YbcL family Raf kinase inhibitor-like protein n=1 Tax=Streptacidiphilus melanogenes TaxID=411235 RepID=UPI001364924E|nr:YbhB/YbcL family Raf kinase inhibitor-like protein [Streptacidiphilus melanogenes]
MTVLGAAAASALLGGCGSAAPKPGAVAAEPARLTVTSSAFRQGGVIPDKYTCKGAGVSLPVAWSGVPAGTGWIALYMEDPTASDFTHWYVVDIPPGTTGLTEGGPSAGRVVAHYYPPCPQDGATDDYVVRVYAMPRGYQPARLGGALVVDAAGLRAHALALGEVDATVTKPA